MNVYHLIANCGVWIGNSLFSVVNGQPVCSVNRVDEILLPYDLPFPPLTLPHIWRCH